jgi:VIT1/CCC1 family predicted Fe2+/Mn2+ transporter
MDDAIKKGFGFGLTSSVITTLGLMIGLHSSTHSRLVVIGGILTIAIADSLSDALGIHISEEAETKHTPKEIWTATISTLLFKFIFAISFLVPVLLLSLDNAIIVSIGYGLILIALFSYYIAKKEHIKPYKSIGEHLFIAIIVIIVTHYLGKLISYYF